MTTTNIIALRRRGVSRTVTGRLSNGNLIEIGYHEGWKRWYYITTQSKPNSRPGWPDISTSTHIRIDGLCLELADVLEIVGKALGVRFDPKIRAYMPRYSEKEIRIWPHIANDIQDEESA